MIIKINFRIKITYVFNIEMNFNNNNNYYYYEWFAPLKLL